MQSQSVHPAFASRGRHETLSVVHPQTPLPMASIFGLFAPRGAQEAEYALDTERIAKEYTNARKAREEEYMKLQNEYMKLHDMQQNKEKANTEQARGNCKNADATHIPQGAAWNLLIRFCCVGRCCGSVGVGDLPNDTDAQVRDRASAVRGACCGPAEGSGGERRRGEGDAGSLDGPRRAPACALCSRTAGWPLRTWFAMHSAF